MIVWNAQHRWVSFFFQSTRGVEDFSGVRPDWLLKNVAGQAVAILPWLWVGLVIELVTGFGRRPPQPERQLVSWLCVPPIVLFTGVAAWSSTSQHHFHWATPGYLLLFLPLGETVCRGLAAGSRLYRAGPAATAAATLIGITVLTSHIATGWLQDLPIRAAGAARSTRSTSTVASASRPPIPSRTAERGGRPHLMLRRDD